MLLPLQSAICFLRPRSPRRGAVTVWLLVCLVVIIGIVAIGMDGGRMLEKRRQAQATADAAALAAATSSFQIDLSQNGNGFGKDKKNAQNAAFAQAAANGFNNDGITSTVTVNMPPGAGAFAGQTDDFIEVIVQYNLSKSFGAIFTNQSLPVTARAVAVGRPLQLGILTLAQTGSNAFLNGSEGTFTVVNGHVFVNSSDSAAFNQSDSGTIIAVTFDITGNYTNSGSGAIQGQVRTGVRRTPDPLLSLAAPDPSGLTVQSSSQLTITTSSKKGSTLQPGVYRGGISIGGSADVTMSPGTYIMQGGGLQIFGNAELTASGVLIYNTSGTASAGPISFTTNGSVSLSAPSSGTYQGISIFQDRSITQTLSITGNGSAAIGGIIYAPSATVNLTGNAKKKKGADTLGGGYVCSTMQVGGKGDINIDPGNNPLLMVPEIALVE